MYNVSNVLRSSAFILSTAAFAVAACATSTIAENPAGPCGLFPCPDGGGDDAAGDNGGDDDGSTGDDDSSIQDTGTKDHHVPPADTGVHGDTGAGQGDGGNPNWVDMTNNTAACEHHNGVACGWSATSNNTGSTCACRHGNWAEGWTCEPANSPTTAGPSCPGVVTTDAGSSEGGVQDSGSQDSGVHDTGTTDSGSTGWVDMTNNAAACDGHVNTPCGWSATDNGAGYTCACRHGDWLDGWTCEAAGSPVTPGSACP